jgi:enamine deaminase RidA (YjgF/YER057c/UK114 family)
MRKQYLDPKPLFEPRFFTHAVSVSAPARLVWISGQVSFDREGRVVGVGDLRAQTEQVFRSLGHCLEAAGATWADVVKLNGYLVNLDAESVRVYREVRARFLDPRRLPASTLVGVTRLVHPDLLLEVEALAALPARASPPGRKKARARR